jgi:hypothetical protein
VVERTANNASDTAAYLCAQNMHAMMFVISQRDRLVMYA